MVPIRLDGGFGWDLVPVQFEAGTLCPVVTAGERKSPCAAIHPAVQQDDQGESRHKHKNGNLHQASLAAQQGQEDSACPDHERPQPDPEETPVQRVQALEAASEAFEMAVERAVAEACHGFVCGLSLLGSLCGSITLPANFLHFDLVSSSVIELGQVCTFCLERLPETIPPGMKPAQSMETCPYPFDRYAREWAGLHILPGTLARNDPTRHETCAVHGDLPLQDLGEACPLISAATCAVLRDLPLNFRRWYH
jgi:hypothetical protein